ncbi:hypothetical protein RIF29_04426 [Crotalaria pallida]|uniref:Secreted protein n=1 Tax=Crotalaria pallida TaxID=3830 RepID=A0AAN9J2D9_CROPI
MLRFYWLFSPKHTSLALSLSLPSSVVVLQKKKKRNETKRKHQLGDTVTETRNSCRHLTLYNSLFPFSISIHSPNRKP